MNPIDKGMELEKVVAMLSEHFDCVQISASEVMPNGGTKGYQRGSGNWYARVQLAREFVETDQANTMAGEIGKEMKG